MAAWGFCTLLCGLAFGQEPALHHGNILAKQEKRIPIREIRKSKPEEARIGSNTHIQIHHTGSKAYLNPDMAKITLKVTFDWGDGSGYQILFDADHNLADSIIPVSTNNLFSDTAAPSLYEAFEYKLPENASGSLTEGYLTGIGRWSIEIPPGTYDYAVLNPTPKTGIWVANGTAGRGDDVVFEGGKEYLFTISRDLVNGNIRDLCQLRIPSAIDLALDQILYPYSKTGLTEATDVRIRIANEGQDTVKAFSVYYQIDEANPIEETVDIPLAPEAVMDYTFLQKADMADTGTYLLQAWVETNGDTVSYNDKQSQTIQHVLPVPAPFVADFNDTSDILRFQVIDANGDGLTWVKTTTIWPDADGNEMDPGSLYGKYVEITFSESRNMDDWLMTFPPVHLPAGNAHVSFNYKGGYDYSQEHLQVYYGNEPDIASMKLLRDIDGFWGGEWFYNAANVRIENEGDYYFAFRACSNTNGYSIMLDNVKVDSGSASGIPDLVVQKVILPTSACGLGTQERIGVQLNNIGAYDLTDYTLTCTIDGTELSSQVFHDTLFLNEPRTVWFDTVADFSSIGKTYEVSISGSVNIAEGSMTENRLEDNEASASVTHYAPATIPFSTDFSLAKDRADWAYDAESWTFDTTYGLFANIGLDPMMSRCLSLEEGQGYRFSFEYMAGIGFMGMYLYEDFDLMYGLTGTDLSTWDTLMSFKDEYSGDFTIAEQTFLCETSGDYVFAFVPRTANGTLYIESVDVTLWAAYDVRLNQFRSLPRLLPADLANAPSAVQVTIENRGMEDIEEAEVRIYDSKDQLAGSKTISLGASGEIARAEIPVSLSGYKADDHDTLTAVVSIPDQTDSEDDNRLSMPLNITREEMAYDRMTDEMYSEYNLIGTDGRFGCGLPFLINASDTLTGVSVGWGAEGSMEFELQIHEWNPETKTLGELVYSGSFNKESGIGQIEYSLPAMLLDSSWYMFAVVLTGEFLVADLLPGGLLYLTTTDPVIEQENLGYPAIRPLLGEGALYSADFAVTQFLKPIEQGLFAVNEPVVVEVANNGFSAAGVNVKLFVDNELIGTENVSVEGYRRTEIEFTADLSEAGEHRILAVAECERDVNPANDSLQMVILCEKATDPYVMDFESCSDFAISNFNPAWTSLDLDATPTLGFQGVTFPHCNDAFGFIAFNPSLTEPAMPADEAPEAQAYEGSRYGAAFDPQGAGQSNDWLISPKLKLPEEGAKMSLYVKSFTSEYGLEKYNLLVSENGNAPEDFSPIGETREAPDSWTLVEEDLSEYAGKEVHVAIQCVSEDAFIFMVDNIQVSNPASNTATLMQNGQISVYPNPASDKVVVSAQNARIQSLRIITLSGQFISSMEGMDTGQIVYNVSDLKAGLYLLNVSTSRGNAILKLVVR